MNTAGIQITQDETVRTATSGAVPVRVVLVQPVIPAYNIPVYEAMAKLDGIDFTVWADLQSKSQLNQYDKRHHQFVAKHLPSKMIGGFVIRPGLLKRLVAERPDIVILNGNQRDISDALAMPLCRLIGCGVAVWNMFHRIGPKLWWSELFMRYAGWMSHLLLCYGERGRSEQLRRGTSPDKIRVISTAIDERSIINVRDSIGKDEVKEFIESQDLAGKHILLHIVRLTEIKRPDLMVNYYARLLQTRDDVELVWIGGGPLEDMVKNRAKELGIFKKMRFLGPVYDERKLALWYLAGSVFVMATCIGLSIHHAMCYGVPVITDDNEFTQASEFEVLQSGVNGFAYRSGDADDFVEKVNRVLDDSDLRKRLSANARKRLEVEYTLARKVENIAAALSFLQSKSRTGSKKHLAFSQ